MKARKVVLRQGKAADTLCTFFWASTGVSQKYSRGSLSLGSSCYMVVVLPPQHHEQLCLKAKGLVISALKGPAKVLFIAKETANEV